MLLPGREGGQRILLEEAERPLVGLRRKLTHRRRNAVLQVGPAPTLVVDEVPRRVAVNGVRGARTVDQERFHQGRAVRHPKLLDEELIHQRNETGHSRRRHAGARFKPVTRPKLIVQFLQLGEVTVIRGGDELEDLQVITHVLLGRIANRVIPKPGRHGYHDIVGAIVHQRSTGQPGADRQHGERHRRAIVRHGPDAHHRDVFGNVNRIEIRVGGPHGEIAVVRRDHVGELLRIDPVLGPRRDYERAGRNHVGLETAVVALDADADIAATGEGHHEVRAVGFVEERRVGHHDVGAAYNVRDGVRVRQIAQRLERADGDHVLGGSR